MFDFLNGVETPIISARDTLVRLLGAMVLGWIVSQVYRRTRPRSTTSASMEGTLVLLAILIAIVTQVVGGNTARAFSLVGALSIVRFRTVVQDTQDTAFVIFAVVMGMAAGAGARWIALIGLVVVSAAAFLMRTRHAAPAPQIAGFRLKIRAATGVQIEEILNPTLDTHLISRRLLSMETARQGMALELIYDVQFRPTSSVEALVKALNRIDGVQNVQLDEADPDDD